MKIPTHLKHKPVIVAENYANIDGRTAYQTDAQGLSLVWHNGMIEERLIFLRRFGGIQVASGLANQKNFPTPRA